MSFIEEVKAIKGTSKQLKEFGITMAVVLGLIGALLLWKGRPSFPVFLGVAAIFLALGLLWPKSLSSVYKVWMSLALVLGWVMTRVILSLLFYAVLTPIGLVVRTQKNQLLNFKPQEGVDTFWMPRKKKRAKEDYEKQF